MPSFFTILVADDNEQVRRTFSTVLQAMGHRCYEAEDGPSCITAAKNNDLQVALLDLYMPNFDIHEVISLFKQQPSPPYLIVVSALDDDRQMEELLQEGIDAYLVKPVDVDQLETLLQEIAANTRS